MKFLYKSEYETITDNSPYDITNLKLIKYDIVIEEKTPMFLEELTFPVMEGKFNTGKVIGDVRTTMPVYLHSHWQAAINNSGMAHNYFIHNYFILVPSTHPNKWYSTNIFNIKGYAI